jgi:hypothetical protein
VQRDLRKRYGLFLNFLSRSGRLDMNAPAGGQVTPENVEGYVAELKSRVSSVTVYGSIQKLRRFVQLIAPRSDRSAVCTTSRYRSVGCGRYCVGFGRLRRSMHEGRMQVPTLAIVWQIPFCDRLICSSRRRSPNRPPWCVIACLVK